MFLSNLEVSLDKPEEQNKEVSDLDKNNEKNLLAGNPKEKTSRNAKCPCGSNKKFKQCCGSLV